VSVSAKVMAPPMAKAYVWAMGAMITPATPVSVKSGTKATPMINVEDNMGPPISVATATTRS